VLQLAHAGLDNVVAELGDDRGRRFSKEHPLLPSQALQLGRGQVRIELLGEGRLGVDVA